MYVFVLLLWKKPSNFRVDPTQIVKWQHFYAIWRCHLVSVDENK